LQTAGVHKSRGPSRPGDKILSGGALCLLILNAELASCQPFGAKNFVVVSSFWKICAFIYLVSRNEIW
jgi:hypothetical protein